MIVCHCRALNDRAVLDAIAEGVDDLHELALRCGAGSRCGGCQPLLVELLLQQRARQHTAA